MPFPTALHNPPHTTSITTTTVRVVCTIRREKREKLGFRLFIPYPSLALTPEQQQQTFTVATPSSIASMYEVTNYP